MTGVEGAPRAQKESGWLSQADRCRQGGEGDGCGGSYRISSCPLWREGAATDAGAAGGKQSQRERCKHRCGGNNNPGEHKLQEEAQKTVG